MEADLAPEQCLAHVGLTDKIAFVKLKVGIGEMCLSQWQEVRPIKATHMVTARKQCIYKMRADEASSTKDKAPP